MALTEVLQLLIENALELRRVFRCEQNVANDSLLLIENHVLLKIHAVELEADRQAMPQVQAQRMQDWRINVDRFYLIEWNLERADPGVQFNAVSENLIPLPQTLLAAV